MGAPVTLIPKGFIGAHAPLADIDLPRIGYQIGVGEDEVHALIDVEASGEPFDAHGRPKALFEPHVFYRHLTGRARDMAVSQGLAYARWGMKPYPADSYGRIEKAMLINEDAALMATSWGVGQIMGENFGILHFASVQAMVAAFCAGAASHIQGMIDFCRANHIDDDLQAHRWAVVARIYNGPGYAANHYDTRLAERFKHWQGIRDTPFTPPPK